MSNTYTPLGITLTEGVAAGISTIRPAGKHNIGLLMARERGIANQPVEIRSLQEDRVRFGGVTNDAWGAIVTRNLYKNAGTFGATYYGVRIVGTGSTAAEISVTSTPHDPSFTEAVVITPAVGLNAESLYKVINPLEGDIFSMKFGGTTLNKTTLLGETAEDVAAALHALIQAEVLAFNPAFDFVATLVGDTIEISHNVTNTAIGAILTVTPDPVDTGFTLRAGQKGTIDVGTWGNDVSATIYPVGDPNGVAGKFMLNVFYQNRRVETFSATTLLELVEVINDKSFYVLGVFTAEVTITAVATYELAGGTYVAPVTADFMPVNLDPQNPEGLALFNATDVQILDCTEEFDLPFVMEAAEYVKTHESRPMFIGCLPYGSDEGDVIDFSAALQSDSNSQTALYNAWVKTSNETGGTVWCPAIGCILGAGFIRVVEANRSLLHFAPAGTQSAFVDAQDVTPAVSLSQATATLWVKRYGINVIKYQQGVGFFLYSSRTTSSNPLFQSIHIRRLTSYYGKSLEQSFLWVLQRPDTPELDRQLYSTMFNFFLREYNDGALENSVAFQEACQISVTRDLQDRRVKIISVDWIPTECIEALRITLDRNDGLLITNGGAA
jgi:hypothetical protein